MDSRDFVAPAQGSVPLEPYCLEVVHFPAEFALSGLSLSHLTTTGFEGLDDFIAEYGTPEAAVPPAPPRVAFLRVSCKPAPPAEAKIDPGFEALTAVPAAVAGSPSIDINPLRARIVKGPNPSVPKPVAPVLAEAKSATTAPVSAPAAAKPAVAAAAKAAPVPAPAKPAAPQPTVNVRPAPATVTVRPPAAPSVREKPAAAAVSVSAAPTPAPPQERPKITIRPSSRPQDPVPQIDRDKRPAPRPGPPGPTRPAVAARDGNALKNNGPEPDVEAAPQSKPRLMPIRTGEPASAPAAAAVSAPSAFENFGMQQVEPSFIGKFWANASTPVKGAAVAALAVAIIAAGTLLFKSSPSRDGGVSGVNGSSTESTIPGMVIGGGGWTTNWGAEIPSNKGKQISLFRPSMVMTDYRLEFRGQIEKKAIGWIFRASNPKNYYVAKLEIVKGGPNPVIALIKYPVIKGLEGTHTQVMLRNDFALDTVYRVRMDVRGNKFTTYVQDNVVDYWTDDQIKTGGAGFYTEAGERAQIKSSQISYLSSTSK